MIQLRMRDIPGVDRSLISKTGNHQGQHSMMGSPLVCLELPIDHQRQLLLEMSMVPAVIVLWSLPLRGRISTNKTASIRDQYRQKGIVPMITTGQIWQLPGPVNPQRHIKATGRLTDIDHRKCKMDVRDTWDRLVVDRLQSIIEWDPRHPHPCLHQIRMHYHCILRQSDPV